MATENIMMDASEPSASGESAEAGRNAVKEEGR